LGILAQTDAGSQNRLDDDSSGSGSYLKTTPQSTSLKVSATFAAFRHRNYRLWFLGQSVSLIGSWMQATAQGYLLFMLTGSAAYLGYIGFISGVPSWLFMIYAGLIADRISRRKLLIMTQSAMMILAFVLAGLVFLNWVQPWHILVLAFFLGVANAFDTPARQALVVDLVEREDMTNAIAFNSTMFNAGLIIGPAAGAAIYALTGPGWCFLINGVSFIAVIIALILMRIKPSTSKPRDGSAIEAIVEGFRYLRGNRLVLTLTISVFVVNIVGLGPINLLPAWAVNILKGDVTTNGLLFSVRGIGAVMGGLLIAATAGLGGRGKLWTTSSILMPLTMLAFTASRNLSLSLFLMAVIGFTLVTMLNNSNAMVMTSVPDELRGRVMGMYSLMFMGGGPLGALLAGLLAARTNEPLTFYVCAIATLVFAGVILVSRPEVRKMA
jgi:MFS family permease